MTLVIGLTGSIASGKSTVSQMFKEMGIPVIDADEISRDVVKPGMPAWREVVEKFGREILFDDGTLNRKKLGEVIFTSETKREELNAIMHPAIRNKMLQQRDGFVLQGERAVVLDIPLLFESKLTHLVEKIIVVYVDEDVQLQRLMERDQSTEQEARQRIHSQIPVKEKVELADAVINNNGTKQESFTQFKEILQSWSIL
ncbi:dephospho-CoA kinase [Virgibacillus soli]|uniref:dephospho-CoA kinase n=1 Tax=Paracerasibacillus soli TaxID=480284 RepID=UPI0035EB4CDB